ncbi:TPA: hypothetical protein I7721_07425 [Vibrio vulnificus]|nr:hypothetical protein [Vibrio vulnificus]
MYFQQRQDVILLETRGDFSPSFLIPPQIPVMPFYVFRTGIDFYLSDLNVTLQISAALAAENEFYSVNRFQL